MLGIMGLNGEAGDESSWKPSVNYVELTSYSEVTDVCNVDVDDWLYVLFFFSFTFHWSAFRYTRGMQSGRDTKERSFDLKVVWTELCFIGL